jgi:lipopolysaccharide biosynthesis glycosyltransferase/ketosteroid isomerase-like protein
LKAFKAESFSNGVGSSIAHQRDVEVIQQIYKALIAGDLPAIMDHIAGDVDFRLFTSSPNFTVSGLRGRAAFKHFFRSTGEAIEPEEIITARDRVIVLGHETSTKERADGRPLRINWAHIWTFRDGLVCGLRESSDAPSQESGLHAPSGRRSHQTRAEPLNDANQSLRKAMNSSIAKLKLLRSENLALNRLVQSRSETHALLQAELHNLWNSRSWQFLRPIRDFFRKRQGMGKETEPIGLSDCEAIRVIVTIRQSLCWELTAPLRLADKLLGPRKMHLAGVADFQSQNYSKNDTADASLGESPEVARDCRGQAFEHGGLHLMEGSVADAIYAMIARREFAAIDVLLKKSGSGAFRSPRIISAALAALFAQLDWKRASQLLETLSTIVGDSGHPEFWLRKIQFLCFTLQLDAAKVFLAECDAPSEVPEIASATVASLHAELAEWDRILDLLRDRVLKGFCIEDEFMESVARAARHTGRYAEVMEQLSRALKARPTPALADFRERLLAEVSLLRSLSLLDPEGEPFAAPIHNPLYMRRAKMLSSVIEGTRGQKASGTIYLCTDMKFLLGASVAVFSLLRNNPAVGRRYSLTVICSDDVLALASKVFQEIAASFSVSICVRPSSALSANEHQLPTRYGFFSRGHSLPNAAYCRIFMAQRLLEEGFRGKALYLDSDTCIGTGVDELVEFDLKRQPLGARVELAMPEVRYAALRAGVVPEKYFNSGVLLFDLSHPDLPNCLARAVDVAWHRHDMLTFHDQCVLNIAFRERTTTLPEEFNSFVRQTDKLEAVMGSPVVSHFLDRPKPWDPMYASVNCMLWYHEFTALGRMLTPNRLKQLFSTAFRI